MSKPFVRDRHFEYAGKDQSIVIGNYGNARIQVSGSFDIEGVVFCPGYKVELLVDGNGKIRFSGTCRELIIHQVQGNCLVDLSEFVTKKMARCVKVTAPSKLILGQVRSLEIISIDEQAVLEYTEQPAILNQSLLRVA